MRLGGSSDSPPRLDLRERQLPWVPLSIPLAVPADKTRPPRHCPAVAGGACSRAASVSIVLLIPRAVTARTSAVPQHGAGDAGSRAGPGVPAWPARRADASNAGVIGVVC